ncbi:MAG TPA: hypothetical protein VH853_13400 [Polyangia bacterium]|jgi:hypothetical protein|nr:hypothetical protein [Polyangia bacterium]
MSNVASVSQTTWALPGPAEVTARDCAKTLLFPQGGRCSTTVFYRNLEV